MAIEATAVARVLGISTAYKIQRNTSIVLLPQRIALFAQGENGITYSEDKWEAPSAHEAGTKYGFKCPIYLALRELKPANGDGIGTIPVDVFPLPNPSGGTAAAGNIVPSGTTTAATTLRLRAGGYLSEPFELPKGAVNVSETLGRIGDAASAVLWFPVKVTYTYGAVTQAPAGTNVGNGTVSALSVTGTPRPGEYSLTLNTAVANGGVFTLTDPKGTVISNSVTMTPGAGAATVVNVGGVQFTLTDAATDFAVGDKFTITVPATQITLTVGWKGVSGNDVKLEIVGDTLGAIFAITQPTGGTVNPTVDAALARVGNVWETMALNGLNIEDTTALDAYQTFGEGRWGALYRKPLVVFTGNVKKTVGDATAVSSGRRTDRVNAQLVAPGSPNIPFVVAARQLARIVKMANDNPPTDYGAEEATGLVAGADGDQWDHTKRDQAVKAGSSTVEVNDGLVQIGDVVTFYRPTGEEPPGYRYVVDIVRLQNSLFNLDLRFAAKGWAAAPMIPDNQATNNSRARRPKDVIAECAATVDDLALAAIISDPAASKKNITANISPTNPKRIDFKVPIYLSGNSNVKSGELEFGFFFGAQQLVA